MAWDAWDGLTGSTLAHRYTQFVGPLVLLATLMSPEPADVDPIPVDLDWVAPEECPDADALRHRIEAMLGRALRFDPDAGARVDAEVREAGGRYRVEITTAIGETREQRTLDASTCSDAADATALVIGLALEPFAATTLVPTPPPVDEPAPAPPIAEASDAAIEPAPRSPELDPGRTPESPRSRANDHRAGLFVGAGASFALTDVVSGGIAGGLAWLPPHARLELAVQHWFANPPNDRQRADVSLTAAALRGAWAPQWGRFELALGAGIEAGAMAATGRGEGVTGQRGSAPFIALVVPIDFAFVASDRLALRARVEGGFVPWRPQFHLESPEGDEVVWTASPASARVTLAAELRLPGKKANGR